MPGPAAFVVLGGPAAAAAAKAVAIESLPYLSSASVAALLAQSAWKRYVPAWIKEDVSFRNGGGGGGGTSTNDEHYPSTTEGDRLFTVVEKIQAWIQEAALRWSDPPVPHAYASLLIYWQLCSSTSLPLSSTSTPLPLPPPLILQQHQQEPSRPGDRLTLPPNGGPKGSTVPTEAQVNNDNEADDGDCRDYDCDPDPDNDRGRLLLLLLRTLGDMLDLATAAYYLDDGDEAYLREQLAGHGGFELLRRYTPTRPGSVGYYLAENRDEKTLLIGIKGTTSLEELLTDVCGRSSSHGSSGASGAAAGGGGGGGGDDSSFRIEVRAREQDQVLHSSNDSSFLEDETKTASGGEDEAEDEGVEIISGHERVCIEQDDPWCDHEGNNSNNYASMESHVRCHEGILMSARRLLAQVRDVLDDRVGEGYRVLIVGHSLGASAAALIAMLLRERYPELMSANNHNHDSNGTDDRRRRLHAYAFGPPPVMDHDTAVAAASYVTTVVNRSDLIVRCSTANLGVLLEFLRILSAELLVPQDLAPVGPKACLRLWQQLRNGSPLWTRDEVARAMDRARERVELRHPDHLYVPGKVYLLQRHEQQQQQQQQADTAATTPVGEDNDNADANNSQPRYHYTCQSVDGTTPSLRVMEMNGFQMLGDHTVVEYRAALSALLLQQQQQEQQQLR